MCGTITADNSSMPPNNPDFNNEGLIATTLIFGRGDNTGPYELSVVNDLFVITQDLILQIADVDTNAPVNWQVRFKEVKLSGPAEAVANYKQYTIYNTSS